MAQNTIYDLVNNLIAATSIQADVAAVSTGSTTTGDYVDTRGGEGPVLGYFAVGAATGSPTSHSTVCTLRQADDSAGSTNEEAITTQSSLTITADDANGFVRALHARRYVACRMVMTMVGGTALDLAASVFIQDKSY